MKKLLIVLLLAGSVSAADFCDGFADYREMAKSRLNVALANTTGIYSDSSMNQIIREGVVFATALRKTARITKKFVTAADVGTYSVDSLIIDVAKVYWSKNDSLKPLTYLPKEQWPTVQLGSLDSYKGYDHRPSFFDWADTSLYLGPVPQTAGDTIVVEGWRKVPNIVSANDETAVLPQKFRLIVIDYVALRLADAKGHPSAAAIRQDFNLKLSAIRSGGEAQQ